MDDPQFVEAFASRLMQCRHRQGLTQEDVARAAQITLRTYTRYEKGQTLPQAAILARLAQVLDVSIDMLLHGHERGEAHA